MSFKNLNIPSVDSYLMEKFRNDSGSHFVPASEGKVAMYRLTPRLHEIMNPFILAYNRSEIYHKERGR